MPGQVSVIIPNFNGAPVLESCFKALARQSLAGFEVVLVDNGSADGSVDMARKLWPEIRIILLGQNRGFAAAVNAGLKAVNSEYAALLNNDVQPEPGWLLELKKTLAYHPRAFAAGPKLLLDPQRDRINVVGIKLKKYAESASIGAGQPDQGRFERPGRVFGVSAGAALYRREVFEDVGYFDEDYFAYLEDVDLSFRARLLGYDFRYAPRARAYHLKGWTTRRRMSSAFEIYHASRNMMFYQTINIPAGTWRARRGRIAARRLELFVRHCIQHAHKGEARPYLAGQLDFLKQRQAVLAKRRIVQSRKRVPDEAITAWLGLEVVEDGVPS